MRTEEEDGALQRRLTSLKGDNKVSNEMLKELCRTVMVRDGGKKQMLNKRFEHSKSRMTSNTVASFYNYIHDRYDHPG